MRELGDTVRIDMLRRSQNRTLRQIGGKAWYQLWDQVENQVWFQVVTQVRFQVEFQVLEEIHG